ncbi:GGDEF domain-containing protein [Sphingomicrobium arenosum]|uniref:GGDEF domain-containing protein n=1 Tax=Sphingomicrobium arenosum TaxID=2233861 RepID=UPI00223F94FC|nr:GGDEF domain-containing protein [Sphingomicrobium arenosum]
MNADSPTGRYDSEIERELIRALIQRARHSIIANIIGIGILIIAALLAPYGELLSIGILFRMFAVSVTALNTNRIRDAFDHDRPITPAVDRFAWGMGFAGVTWGGLLFCLPLSAFETLGATLILAVVLTGVCLIIAVASPVPRVMWSYALGFAGPLFAWLALLAPVHGIVPAIATVGLGAAALSLGVGMGRESRDTAKVAIENQILANKLSDLNEELRATVAEKDHLALHDVLTGLPNRRHFEARTQAIAASGGEQRWSLLLIDLDHFKRINDAAGHGGGDEVLRAMGHLLGSLIHALPGEAFAARIGGEEFALLVEGVRDSAVKDIGISLGASTRVIPAPAGYDGTISASIGVTRWAAGEAVDRVLRRADEALYDAKEGGRNRVMVRDAGVPDLPYEAPKARPAGG